MFPPHADPAGDCVLRRLLVDAPWRAEIAWPEGFAGGICHRLDTSTSGAVLVADEVAELAELRRAFGAGEVAKTYRLRVARAPVWWENACDRPIAHDKRHARRMIVQRGRDTPHRGRWLEAHTRLLRLEGDLLEAVITTGVMHQIRVHAAFLGVPLLGDRLYGGGPTPAGAPDGVEFFLHHVGMEGPGWRTAAIGLPGWATLDL